MQESLQTISKFLDRNVQKKVDTNCAEITKKCIKELGKCHKEKVGRD